LVWLSKPKSVRRTDVFEKGGKALGPRLPREVGGVLPRRVSQFFGRRLMGHRQSYGGGGGLMVVGRDQKRVLLVVEHFA
jgi:hypothetical protein